jgi:hypothetical protein
MHRVPQVQHPCHLWHWWTDIDTAPSPRVRCAHSVGVGKCIGHVPRGSGIRNARFLSIPPSSSIPSNHRGFCCFHTFTLSRKSYRWNYNNSVSLHNMHVSLPHVSSWRRNSCLSRTKYSIAWMCCSLFIHSSTKGCLGCFQALAVMNKLI